MNLKIANRLLAYRRAHGLSQEELAEKIGVSRQAVSKWERAEASPDTDNLIALASLYGVLIDELINGEGDPQVKSEEQTEENSEDNAEEKIEEKNDSTYGDENYSRVGINIEDGEDKIHVGLSGIHIVEKNGGDEVHIDARGIHIKDGNRDDDDDDDDDEESGRFGWLTAATPILCSIAYLILGFTTPGGWACGWILYFLVPIVPSLISAIRSRRPSRFAYPVLVTALYLTAGMCFGRWHPEWIIFLTVPIYYMAVEPFEKKAKKED